MAAEKANGFFRKTFKNLTKLLSGRYRKTSKPSQNLHPFSCGCCRENVAKVGHVRAELSKEEKDTDRRRVAGNSERKKKQRSSRLEKMATREGELEIARRMKELERMGDGCDLEHALDVEEALHYYSRLKSPVYVEIVDRFVMDMYGDFSTPQQHPSGTGTGTGSRRRLGSIRFLVQGGVRGHEDLIMRLPVCSD